MPENSLDAHGAQRRLRAIKVLDRHRLLRHPTLYAENLAGYANGQLFTAAARRWA
jgi:hypothetical protein